MIVLGISGGPHVHPDEAAGVPYADGYWHDAAACVVVDGRLVSAHAEERHTRVKHTSLFPTHAVRAALADAEATARDVDAVAVYFTEAYWRRYLALVRHHLPDHPAGEPRDLLQAALARAGGEDLAHAPLEFVDHHLAHGFAALHRAGRAADDCLLVTLDGAGDAESGRVVRVRPGGRLRTVWTVPLGQSLGGMYLHVTRHLGLGQFDEYKVMGLAALGDPGALRDRLAMVSVDGPEWYAIRWSFTQRLERLLPARRREDPVRDVHADVAACVQDALERAVLKVVRHAHDLAPADVLCLSGGVAHNAALNGRLQREAPVDRVLVPFAADDSGCALGAALARAHARARAAPRRRPAVARGGARHALPGHGRPRRRRRGRPRAQALGRPRRAHVLRRPAPARRRRRARARGRRVRGRRARPRRVRSASPGQPQHPRPARPRRRPRPAQRRRQGARGVPPVRTRRRRRGRRGVL